MAHLQHQEPKLPQLKYDGNTALPVQQLKTLRNHLDQLLRRVADLQETIHGRGRIEGPSWPELLTKYNNILQQTVLIFEQLSLKPHPAGLPPELASALASASAVNEEWPRPPQNALPNVLLHPSKVIAPGAHEMALIGLVGISRPPPLLESDINLVKRFEVEREIKHGIKKKAGHGEINIEPVAAHHIIPAHTRATAPRDVSPAEIIHDMDVIRKEWDARAERGLRAVQMLKEKYHWRVRPDFATHDMEVEEELRKQEQQRQDEEAQEIKPVQPPVVGGIVDRGESPEVQEILTGRSTGVGEASHPIILSGEDTNDEQDEGEAEDQVMVESDEDDDMADVVEVVREQPTEVADVPQEDIIIGTTPDSDDDLFEEVA